MDFIRTTRWDSAFFERFSELRNQVHGADPHFLKESETDLAHYFGEGTPFSRNNEWEALLLERDGFVMGRAVVSRPKYWPTDRFIPVGWFECVEDSGVARSLITWAESWARERGYAELRGPMDGNFFYKYRWRLPGGGVPFQGEPLAPAYYHDYFQANGFEVVRRWKSIVNNVALEKVNTEKILKKLGGLQNTDITVRELDTKHWPRELRLFYDMLSSSFRGMGDFMPISFEEFAADYDSFKYLIHRELCFVLEHEGEPVGFMISYFDPLPAMLKAQASPWPWRKLVALWEMRKKKGRLLIPYVGKVPGNREVKGVIGILGDELLKRISKYVSEYTACYIADESRTWGSVLPGQTIHGEYVLYKKSLGGSA